MNSQWSFPSVTGDDENGGSREELSRVLLSDSCFENHLPNLTTLAPGRIKRDDAS
jgi:hypothetical protein